MGEKRVVSDICISPDGNTILLVYNTDEEKGRGFWGLPGGKMKEKEILEDGAIRELHQETNQEGRATRHKLEISQNGPKGIYLHTYIFVKIISENELKNNEDPLAIPQKIPIQEITKGRIKVFPSHIRGWTLLFEKMTGEKQNISEVDRHGIRVISKGSPVLLEILHNLKNCFDERGRYITPFRQRR